MCVLYHDCTCVVQLRQTLLLNRLDRLSRFTLEHRLCLAWLRRNLTERGAQGPQAVLGYGSASAKLPFCSWIACIAPASLAKAT
jgi:hypothetical protein